MVQPGVWDEGEFVNTLSILVVIKVELGKWQQCAVLVIAWWATIAASSRVDLPGTDWIFQCHKPEEMELLESWLQKEMNEVLKVPGNNSSV